MKKILAVAFCILVGMPAVGRSAVGNDDLPVDEVTMYVGQMQRFPVNVPQRIVVGKPEIADVTEVTDKEVAVAAKSPGMTTFMVWDNFGEQHYRIRVYNEDMRETQNRVNSVLSELKLPDVYTRPLDSESKVLLLGEVKTAQDRERILTALAGVKDRVVDLIKVGEEETAVDIDVQVLELSKDGSRTLGITWPSTFRLATDANADGNEWYSNVATNPNNQWSTVFRVINWSRTNFQWTLDLLEKEGKARILSRPRLACQSGKEAELMVGGEKPIFTTEIASSGGSGTTIEYKEYGIKLKIKPTVTAKDRIKLALNIEVSEVGTAEFIGATSERTAQAYPLTKRNISTELFLNDGQTLAIGGLMKQKQEDEVTKVPVMGDVPIIGMFFRSKTKKVGGGAGERGSVELFITLTPRIIAETRRGAQETEKPPAPEPPKIPAPAPAPETMTGDPVYDYSRIIQRRILERLTYPTAARQAGFQGTVRLKLKLSYLGELLESVIKESSGYALLDEHALQIAKGIASYPPFPPALESKEIWIDIPVTFSLD